MSVPKSCKSSPSKSGRAAKSFDAMFLMASSTTFTLSVELSGGSAICRLPQRNCAVRHSVGSGHSRPIRPRRQPLLVHGEAIEQTGATGVTESILATTVCTVRGVPRTRIVALSQSIKVTHLRATGATRRGPVAAGAMCAGGKRGTVRTRTGKDFVLVRVHLVGALGDSCFFAEPTESAMKLCHV